MIRNSFSFVEYELSRFIVTYSAIGPFLMQSFVKRLSIAQKGRHFAIFHAIGYNYHIEFRIKLTHISNPESRLILLGFRKFVMFMQYEKPKISI